MNVIGNIAAISVLICMAVQDFRSRTISVWLLPAIVFCLVISQFDAIRVKAHVVNGVFNTGLLLVQFIVLWLVVSLRNRKWTNIINTQIGTGDIVLLVCLTPFFSPLNYFVLFSFVILFSLAVILICRAMNRLKSDYIPFAGLYAIPLIILCALRLFFPEQISFSSDEWLNTYVIASGY
jgi:hypothetical protein